MRGWDELMNWKTRTERPPAQALRAITLVVAEPAALAAVHAALEREHYLGAVTPNNRAVVKLAVRGPRCWRSWCGRERPETGGARSVAWVGRAHAALAAARAEQPFLILSQVRQTNLVSRVLGLAVAARPEQWHQRTGVRPLLATLRPTSRCCAASSSSGGDDDTPKNVRPPSSSATNVTCPPPCVNFLGHLRGSSAEPCVQVRLAFLSRAEPKRLRYGGGLARQETGMLPTLKHLWNFPLTHLRAPRLFTVPLAAR